MLLSLILFGSRARGDHRMKSDVDLLGITDAWRKSSPSKRGTSIHLYDHENLLRKSQNGDLFVCHLVREGVVLHDTAGVFRKIRTAFRFKKSYSSEIKCGSSIIKFLTQNEFDFDQIDVRKRLVWAIRTVIIARAANNEEVAFSSKALETFANMPGLANVIDNRSTVEALKLLAMAQSVDDIYGFKNRNSKFPSDLHDQVRYLQGIGGVAESTLSLTSVNITDPILDYH